MATKLKNLKVKKVDFVDEGANPDAHIPLFKRKDPADGDEKPTVMERIISTLTKSVDAIVAERVADVAKSTSFSENLQAENKRDVLDQIWRFVYALENSFDSIIEDEELDSAARASEMQKSLDEFYNAFKAAITNWSIGSTANVEASEGELTEDEIAGMKAIIARLTSTIEKASAQQDVVNQPGEPEAAKKSIGEGQEGETDMKIDKSKMTPEELATFEDLEKRYGVEEPENVGKAKEEADIPDDDETKKEKPEVKKSAEADDTDDIYKGLNPAVKAELESLKKFREEAEDRQMLEVAKRYEIIGKKPEELAPLLKSLKAAGGTAYDDMIAVLDQTVETVNQSGVFGEIGKRGGNAEAGDVESEVAKKATELMKSRTGLSFIQAKAEVLSTDAELAKRYEEEE